MKIGVLLSGCGVYDGSEIHEAVFTLLALDKAGVEVVCLAPDLPQHHVIDHIHGKEMEEQRNILVESARIARGNIRALHTVNPEDLDALVMPGGFGVAKNFTKWAFEGYEGEIEPQIKEFIVRIVELNKPIAALCMAPTTIAKALASTGLKAKITVGTTSAHSPYDIQAISDGMTALGAEAQFCDIDHFVFDDTNNIITSPCYMMEASISQVYDAIKKTISKLIEVTELHLTDKEELINLQPSS